MTFASITPHLKRHGRSVRMWNQTGQLVSGAAALAVVVALAIILVALFEGINRPNNSSPTAIPQPPSLAMGAVYTASIVGADEGQISLLGYELSTVQPAPGAMFTVTLHWQARRKMVNDYVAFVHLLDASGNLVTESDAVPASGTRPTTGWLPGERIADSHTLALPTHLAAGHYGLSVGLYDPKSGARLGESALLDRSITIAP